MDLDLLWRLFLGANVVICENVGKGLQKMVLTRFLGEQKGFKSRNDGAAYDGSRKALYPLHGL